MSPFDQLLQQLPPDRRVEAALAFEKLSNDRNSPIFSLYVEVLESIEAKKRETESRLSEKLAASAVRDKEIIAQLSAAHADVKCGRHEIAALSGKTLWWRIIASRIVGAAIWTAMVAGLTTYFVETKVRTVDPEFHARIEAVESKIQQRIDDQAQLTNVRINQVMDLAQETNGTISKTLVQTASQTLIGKGLSFYVSSIDDTHITVAVDGRSLTLPHQLSENEILQLKLAIGIEKKIQIK